MRTTFIIIRTVFVLMTVLDYSGETLSAWTERLKHNFPEGFDSVGIKAAYRDIQMQSVLSASEDNILKVWNPETGEV
jgi:hypothetical protein